MDRIQVGGEIFRTRPDRSCGPPSLLYSAYRVSLPGVKRPGRGVDHPPASSTEVEGRVELYFCFPFGPSWPALGRALPLPLPCIVMLNGHEEMDTGYVL